MDVNFSAFREPRGVMRILHFIFSICAFATITGYSGFISFKHCNLDIKWDYDYPFNLVFEKNVTLSNNHTCPVSYNTNFSSDSKFFVATGVLAMLYAIAISVFYIKFDDMYKTNNQLPLIDFVITVIFGVLWLSSSAAWANSLSGLKSVVSVSQCECIPHTSSFSTLNISVIFGFLNFVLWAADLWFLYKETVWFQGNQPQTTSGV